MSFDNLCKLLSEKYPTNFASWVLGTPQTNVEVLKTELSIEPIRADYVTFKQLQGRILHLEFQTKLESTPPLPLRMLDYWVRLYRLYRLPVTQVVVLLLPPTPATVIETCFNVEMTRHEYRVICMWEENPEMFLKDEALLPLAPLTATTQPQILLQRVVEQVNQIEVGKRPEISAYTQILAGLEALSEILSNLSPAFPAPIAIVQHLSPFHRSWMAEILNRRTPLLVKEAQSDDWLERGKVYIAPPNFHLIVKSNETLALTSTEKVRHVRPAGDVLFKSVAETFRERAIAVVLTGMDSDGTAGVKVIKQMGGRVIAQDEASSKYFSMPSSAINTGDVDFILPLSAIAPTLVSLVGS